MKYNDKYDRWVTKGGLVYRYSKRQDKLVLCKQGKNKFGYYLVKVSKPKNTHISVHRIVWETFNGEIPKEKEIDHINTLKDDNKLENLRLCTHKENQNNPLSIQHQSVAKLGKTKSDFGDKFKEHFGITKNENPRLYNTELNWYKRNNKCRWEK